MMKATQENTTCDNLANRIFKTGIPYNILLTDITYLFYGNNKKCYLSTIKDAKTNEILDYYISENMTFNNQCLEEVIIGIMHLRNHILVI